ncbi:MAG: M3 family metallopeptidase [Bdellovibrionota bacterium]
MKISKQFLLTCIVLGATACQSKAPSVGGGPIDVTPPDNSLLAKPSKATPESAAHLIRYEFKKGELTSLCNASIQRTKEALAAIAQIPAGKATFDNAMLAFEKATADFSDDTTPLSFMKYVSTEEGIQKEGADCETAVGDYGVEITTDKKVYAVLKSVTARNAAETRLAKQTLLGYEQNGMNLSDADLQKFRELNQALTKKQADYSNNLNLDKTHIEVTAEELAGLPQTFIDRQTKTADGKLSVNANEADYPVVMANASNEETRKKMMRAYLTRGGQANLDLLSDAVVLREQIAQLVLPSKNSDGTPADQTWVTYRVRPKMVKTRKTIVDFLDGLTGKLAERNGEDFAQLLAFKKTIDPNATSLNAWDITYMSNQLKKQSFSVDEEEIRKYFPADVVIQGLFSVYSEMLGVDYKEVANAKVWADGVKLYEIRDHADSRLIGYFYTDFYPRPDTGKYDHAAAFPIYSGRMTAGGYYSLPVSSIVANISPPVNGQAALLSHDDVETIFHEFGHIMHQTLTRAPYASLSGSNVEQDFVEAPSQMLENWVWQPEILKRLSGLPSDHNQHLPDDLLAKMIEARDFQQGAQYTKQLLYSTFDINIHSQSGPVDVNKTYADLYVQIMGQQPLEGQMFPASFGHLMGGYDAGYYGYLWSKVYAQDMFSVFKAAGLTTPEIGRRYRKTILEYGAMMDAIDLLPKFLGRAPSKDAFYSDLHIKQ